MTQWKIVFSGFRNVEFNRSFVKKMVEMIDLRKKETWDRMEREAEEKRKADEAIEAQREANLIEGIEYIKKCDGLMNRAAEIGPKAFSLDEILKTLSPTEIRNELGSRVQVFA
jgi:hypothetical protein